MLADIGTVKLIYYITLFVSCRPLQAWWLKEDPIWASTHEFTCINIGSFMETMNTISATEDLILALMPTMLLWNMHLPARQKIGIWTVFAMSIFTSVVGYARSYFIVQTMSADNKDWTCKITFHQIHRTVGFQ